MTEVPCPECGASVEIFKDEASGRCRRCGHKFLNPHGDFGCAQWCALANECLGFAPAKSPATAGGEGALAARLIQWIEQRFCGEPARIVAALRAFQRAKELLREQGGNPRVTLTAALLLAIAAPSPDAVRGTAKCGAKESQVSGATAGLPAVSAAGDAPQGEAPPEVLERLGLEADTLAAVRQIVDCCQRGETMDTIEFRVARDANAPGPSHHA